MFILIAGVIVFLGVHTLTTISERRTVLIERLGLLSPAGRRAASDER